MSADVWNWDQMKSNKNKRAKVRSELQQLQITLSCGSKMIHFTFNCIALQAAPFRGDAGLRLT